MTSPISVSFTMVPLQAVLRVSDCCVSGGSAPEPTKLLLDHLEDLLLVEFLGEPLDRGQCLATIALCERNVSLYGGSFACVGYGLTLDTDVDVVLRLLGVASGISIGLCKGVCVTCQSAGGVQNDVVCVVSSATC